MKLITLDFETYYSREYSLTKMSTEEYICDPRFQVIGVGFKIHDSNKTYWVDATRGMPYLQRLLELADIRNSGLLCQNTMFDALILKVHFNLTPKMYFDTRLMANPLIRPFSRSVSLKAIGTTLDLPTQKGDEVIQAMGKRLEDFSYDELTRYGNYCRNDVNMTYQAFKVMAPLMAKDDLRVIDKTLRMYLQPTFKVDPEPLAVLLQETREENARLLSMVSEKYSKSDLMSNPKFAQALVDCGIDPPMKISPTTGKQTFAFAKTDQEFMDLQEHEDGFVRALVAARISSKSTIDETRCLRLLNIAEKFQYLRVPLLYYGAHTGRYSGMERINLQNLRRGAGLRSALVPADDNDVVWAADYSQIEARLTAWLARQLDLVQAFAAGEDVYSGFASEYYGYPVNAADHPTERFFGKTCILGLGFGMGWEKFLYTANLKGFGLTEKQARRAVDLYRNRYHKIQTLWDTLDSLIAFMHRATPTETANLGPLKFGRNKVILPNGMPMIYHNLRRERNAEGTATEWVFDYNGKTKRLWGSKLCENVIQALAQVIAKQALLRVESRLKVRVGLQAHDELVGTTPRKTAQRTLDRIIKEMSVVPAWAKGLPIAVEGALGDNYGEAK